MCRIYYYGHVSIELKSVIGNIAIRQPLTKSKNKNRHSVCAHTHTHSTRQNVLCTKTGHASSAAKEEGESQRERGGGGVANSAPINGKNSKSSQNVTLNITHSPVTRQHCGEIIFVVRVVF